ncbi:PREDICTED: uncharacterized protein LOC105553490 [Mandrillus leucophaeus]|uniref:uncharacterized protein LOC105553490 n=1 Tax=Mandrillus leucophaeus TaxID=9568 RepID=UPI0005F4C603|nr:PREDICTED: uncharacterized protein LOC105553490 [Mandrillus leucophaeus]
MTQDGYWDCGWEAMLLRHQELGKITYGMPEINPASAAPGGLQILVWPQPLYSTGPDRTRGKQSVKTAPPVGGGGVAASGLADLGAYPPSRCTGSGTPRPLSVGTVGSTQETTEFFGLTRREVFFPVRGSEVREMAGLSVPPTYAQLRGPIPAKRPLWKEVSLTGKACVHNDGPCVRYVNANQDCVRWWSVRDSSVRVLLAVTVHELARRWLRRGEPPPPGRAFRTPQVCPGEQSRPGQAQ